MVITFEWVSLIVSIVSVVLALVAIWLSRTFFVMSQTQARYSEQAADNVRSSVDTLAALNDILQSKILDLLHEAQSESRHIGGDMINALSMIYPQLQHNAPDAISDSLDQKLDQLLAQTDKSKAEFRAEIKAAVNEIITSYKEATEAETVETLRDISTITQEDIFSIHLLIDVIAYFAAQDEPVSWEELRKEFWHEKERHLDAALTMLIRRLSLVKEFNNRFQIVDKKRAEKILGISTHLS